MDKREDPVAKAVIEVASRLLQEEGPDALTNRRIARDAGTSTMSIYSRFGAKGGILDALYLEGVQRLSDAQGRVGHLPDARQEVLALCRAWRAEAMAHPGHYRVVFGEPVPGWSPSDDLRQQSLRTWLRLRDAVFRAVSARRCAGSPDTLAWALFSACHGLVTLELRGVQPIAGDPETGFLEAMSRILGPTPTR